MENVGKQAESVVPALRCEIGADSDKLQRDRLIFELMLIVVVIGMAYLLYRMGAHSIVVLNLFYLPIVLSGYFLGRRSAGVLAFFCVVAATIATVGNSSGFAAFTSPIMIGLVITIWAAVLGLTAILVGTLSDERASKLAELHEAYVGVVDVLSAYLQSANPKYKARSIRVAEISQRVASSMRLSPAQIDNVRIAALLHDMGNIEVTTKLISRAVDSLASQETGVSKHTFLGSDLAHSLGTVMHGAVPLVLAQNDDLREAVASEVGGDEAMPIGAAIIRAVRAFDEYMVNAEDDSAKTAKEVIHKLNADPHVRYDTNVLSALDHVVAAEKVGAKREMAIGTV